MERGREREHQVRDRRTEGGREGGREREGGKERLSLFYSSETIMQLV